MMNQLTSENYDSILDNLYRYNLDAAFYDQLPTFSEIEHLNLKYTEFPKFIEGDIEYEASTYVIEGDIIESLSKLSHLYTIDVDHLTNPTTGEISSYIKLRGVLKTENKKPGYLKMYIATLDEAPDYMYGTLVAHSVLGAHLKFTADGHEEYQEWINNSFRKVTVRVSRDEFDAILQLDQPIYQGYENTICSGKTTCLVTLARQGEVPEPLHNAKLWTPKI